MKRILALLLIAALALMLTGCFKGWGKNNEVVVNGETVLDTTESED